MDIEFVNIPLSETDNKESKPKKKTMRDIFVIPSKKSCCTECKKGKTCKSKK